MHTFSEHLGWPGNLSCRTCSSPKNLNSFHMSVQEKIKSKQQKIFIHRQWLSLTLFLQWQTRIPLFHSWRIVHISSRPIDKLRAFYFSRARGLWRLRVSYLLGGRTRYTGGRDIGNKVSPSHLASFPALPYLSFHNWKFFTLQMQIRSSAGFPAGWKMTCSRLMIKNEALPLFLTYIVIRIIM